MPPAANNITIYQGDTFELIIRLKDSTNAYVNLTGATPKSQIRANTATSTVMAEFTAALLTQSGSTLGGFKLSLTASQTTGLTGNGFYDAQITWPDGSVKTYVAGSVTLIPEITRV